MFYLIVTAVGITTIGSYFTFNKKKNFQKNKNKKRNLPICIEIKKQKNKQIKIQ